MRLSKARMEIADKGLYLHVNPHTGAEFESQHKVLIFSDHPGDPPMTLARAQKLLADDEAPARKPRPAKTHAHAGAAPISARKPPPQAASTAMRVHAAEEKVRTRAWTPGAAAKKS